MQSIVKDMDAEMSRMKFSLNKYADHLKKQHAAKKTKKRALRKKGAPSNNIPNPTGAEALMPLVPTQTEAAPAEKEAAEKTDKADQADQTGPSQPPLSYEI